MNSENDQEIRLAGPLNEFPFADWFRVIKAWRTWGIGSLDRMSKSCNPSFDAIFIQSAELIGSKTTVCRVLKRLIC